MNLLLLDGDCYESVRYGGGCFGKMQIVFCATIDKQKQLILGIKSEYSGTYDAHFTETLLCFLQSIVLNNFLLSRSFPIFHLTKQKNEEQTEKKKKTLVFSSFFFQKVGQPSRKCFDLKWKSATFFKANVNRSEILKSFPIDLVVKTFIFNWPLNLKVMKDFNEFRS